MRVIKYNPCWDIEKMPHTPRTKIIPTEEQMYKILTVADPFSERPFISVLLHTAARVDEILRLKWSDIDFRKRKITRWTLKRKGGVYEPIVTAMNKELHTVLKNLWDSRTQEKWVFLNEKTRDRFHRRPKLMKTRCKRAKIDPPFGFHAIRHFTASFLADSEKVSKKTISSILGHKSLQTSEIYLHNIDESQRVAMTLLERMRF